MTGSWLRPAFSVGLFLSFLAVALQGVQCEELESVPPEDLCRPYIEKALKDFGTGSLEQISAEVEGGEKKHEEETPLVSEETDEIKEEDETKLDDKQDPDKEKSTEATETDVSETTESIEEITEEKSVASEEKVDDESANVSAEEIQEDKSPEEETAEDASEGEIEKEEGKSDETVETVEGAKDQSDEQADEDSGEKKAEESDVDKNEDDEKSDEKSDENADNAEAISDETKASSAETIDDDKDESVKDNEDKGISDETTEDEKIDSTEDVDIQKTSEETKDEEKSAEDASNVDDLSEETETLNEEEKESKEEIQVEKKDTETSVEDEHKEESVEDEQTKESVEDEQKEESVEDEQKEESVEDEQKKESAEDEQKEESVENDKKEESIEDDEQDENADENKSDVSTKSEDEKVKSSGEKTEEIKSRERRAIGEEKEEETASKEKDEDENNVEESKRSDEIEEPTPEEDLIQEIEVPENLRPREHINQLLKLDEENEDKERAIQKVADIVLRDLKRLYDNAIQPLESLYKYRDLSNRHFGDPEIFSKPLVLFMGPWSGGKSSIINYLLDIEYKPTALRTGGLRECLEEHCKSPNGTDTGAEPSPAYFNILMHGEEEEVLDGTQLAADWTFSGLQKFGQGMLDRLRGLRLNNKLLEKVNIVEIPGILEIRKQVQRLFPFNDACQWFIDRADIIFLVYDPSKLDVGPETEAILDQLKGREYQTRIILNKADHVKPEELMRVQGALIWNISPLMSSAEPPIMYSTSLWSLPYETGAPTRLLYAQERAFLRDLRSAIDKRVEHKIASARRFAVRVRNHAKMVDCYLTTYYNHKTFFGNKKEISDKIIENPQNYHIYEGLSTLTNISRYDLPDPDVYRDFFRLNPLYDFQLLSSTCTYFRGCPINRLDVAIAYDLPELVGKYKKSVEVVIHENETNSPPS